MIIYNEHVRGVWNSEQAKLKLLPMVMYMENGSTAEGGKVITKIMSPFYVDSHRLTSMFSWLTGGLASPKKVQDPAPWRDPKNWPRPFFPLSTSFLYFCLWKLQRLFRYGKMFAMTTFIVDLWSNIYPKMLIFGIIVKNQFFHRDSGKIRFLRFHQKLRVLEYMLLHKS